MSQYESDWYRSFFGQDYLDVYGHVLGEDRSQAEADFVRGALALEPGQRVLDLCCGQGRHAVPLARAGLRVTGLDMSESYLRLAASAAEAAGVDLDTVVGDMREIPYEAEFDAVVNMFTAFGYFDDESDDRRVLGGIAGALKPGGRVLLDLLNRDWVAANYIESEWRRSEDETLYLEQREFDPVAGRNHVEFTIVSPDGSTRRTGHHIRLYVMTEMISMLTSAGLDFERAYGDYDGSPLSVHKRRMIVVARKLP